MAKTFECSTRSATGNLVLGGLFLVCGFGLLAMPCLGIVGTVFGAVTPPHDSHEALGILFVLGVLLVMAFSMLALGTFCMNATLLPRTLRVADGNLEFFWFRKQLGRIPLANVKNVIIKTRAMAGQTADKAYWNAFFAGGIIAATVARHRFDPNEPIGFIIQLVDARDPDTFWPRGIIKRFKSTPGKRIEVDYYWKLPHRRLVEKITKALSRCPDESAAPAGRWPTDVVDA